MKVYRYLTKTELDYILANNLNNIGCSYSSDFFSRKVNTHNYEKDVRYLHFYKNKNDISKYHYSSIPRKNEIYFICEFNIPFLKLVKNAGFGFYVSSKNKENIEKVREYILPSQEMKKSYLKKYEHYALYYPEYKLEGIQQIVKNEEKETDEKQQ